MEVPIIFLDDELADLMQRSGCKQVSELVNRAFSVYGVVLGWRDQRPTMNDVRVLLDSLRETA